MARLLLLRESAVAAIVILAGLLVLWLLSLLLGWLSVNMPRDLLAIDIALYRVLATINNQTFTAAGFAVLNDPGLDYTLPIGACLIYVWARRRADFVPAAAAVALTLVVGAWTMSPTQAFGFRPRPFMIVDVPIIEYWRQTWAQIPSFPSGHVRELAGLTIVVSHYWRRSRVAAFAFLGIVAVARIYLGAHFPTDVVAGLIVGLIAGTYSVLAVGCVTRVALALGERPATRRALDYVLAARGGDRSVLLALALRSALLFALLCLAAVALGLLFYTTTPRILADYLRNTDNSIAYPLMQHFDAGLAQIAYPIFADPYKPAVAVFVLILLRSLIGRRPQDIGRTATAAVVAVLVAELVAFLISPHFQRPRPLAAPDVPLPMEWQAIWPGFSSLPYGRLLALVALTSTLARAWPSLRGPAYAYAVVATWMMVYFGASWPTDALASLIVGYLAGRYAIDVSGRMWGADRSGEARSPSAPSGWRGR